MRALIAIVLSFLLAIPGPVMAGNTLVPAGVRVTIAKSGLSVVPPIDMNRLGASPGRQAEAWTLDGVQLNRFVLIGGVPDGQPFLRERDRKDRPLPRFSASGDALSLFDFYAETVTSAMPGVTVSLLALEPAERSGCSGIIAEFRQLMADDNIERTGRAFLCRKDGKLYGLTLVAPSLHYFPRDRRTFEALLDSFRL
ncbi:hypothetical protein [Thermaurantiacus sp.]